MVNDSLFPWYHTHMQALLFRNGEEVLGLSPEPEAFRRYLQRAEGLGDPEALFYLADMHWHGQSVGTPRLA